MAVKFNGKQITDQKRLVRGEHLLFARTRLQARDCVHHRRWRVLMLAGGSPAGEIKAIRELMPLAHITAVDKDGNCLDAAIDAGVDEIVECDLVQWKSLPFSEKFDLVDLDLCSNINLDTRTIARHAPRLVGNKGVLMFTFSYGRDVLPAINDAWSWEASRYFDSLITDERQCPEGIARRVAFLFSRARWESLRSIAVYRGASMPMCSLLFQLNEYRVGKISFSKVEVGDFEIAAVYPNAANLYDCPQERIESLRRKFAAIKASYTRTEKSKQSNGKG